MRAAVFFLSLSLSGIGFAQDKADLDVLECEAKVDKMIEQLRESYTDDHPSIGHLKNLRAQCGLMMKKDWELKHPLQEDLNLIDKDPIKT